MKQTWSLLSDVRALWDIGASQLNTHWIVECNSKRSDGEVWGMAEVSLRGHGQDQKIKEDFSGEVTLEI